MKPGMSAKPSGGQFAQILGLLLYSLLRPDLWCYTLGFVIPGK